MTETLNFGFENSYAEQLEGFYASWTGDAAPDAKIVLLNDALAEQLGINAARLNTAEGAQILTGSAIACGSQPLAMAYAGHQFGGFSPQLGDGRALLLGEVIDQDGQRRDIHLKGSGKTPFSRGGDGKAVLAPVLREYIIGEAMHALNIPTTRALAACTTGEQILRQNGLEPGAVLSRVASSHIRVGTFQFFAARGETDRLWQLLDYAINRHDPDLAGQDGRALAFLTRVAERQAVLLAQWMQVGFVHGVMNTDNMTVSGETIDYGPCAFIDRYAAETVFSSIDSGGRYAYGQQPVAAQWNLARLAEALLVLIDPDTDRAIRLASGVVTGFIDNYQAHWLAGMGAKIGLPPTDSSDGQLLKDLFVAMEGQNADYTRFFRHLAEAAEGDNDSVVALFDDPQKITAWLTSWRARLAQDDVLPAARRGAMDAVNPVYIPRNHLVEAALQAASQEGDLTAVKTLLTVLSDPFTRRVGFEEYETGAGDNAPAYRTFCGT